MAGLSSKSAVAKGKRPAKTTPATRPEKQGAQHKRQRLTPTSVSKSVLEARPVALGEANWLKTEGQETLLAGYVGFKKVEDLRRLVISWPILTIWPLFNANASQLPKKSPFRLAHERWDSLISIPSITHNTLATPTDASHDIAKKQRQLRAAWCCLRLMVLLDTYNTNSPAQNMAENKTAQAEIASGRGLIFPDHKAQHIFTQINLGPVNEHEHRLEKVNRCWELLKYFGWLKSMPTSGWTRVATINAIRNAPLVNDHNLPSSMQAPKAEAKSQLSYDKFHEKYHPIAITVIWLRSKKFPQKEELDVALEVAEEKGLKIPTSYKLSNGPERKFSSGLRSLTSDLMYFGTYRSIWLSWWTMSAKTSASTAHHGCVGMLNNTLFDADGMYNTHISFGGGL